MKITNLQARKVIPMAYPVAGSYSCAGYSGYGTAAFALVLFILLVIILRAGIGFY
jgi:predicted exporter